MMEQLGQHQFVNDEPMLPVQNYFRKARICLEEC